ncbi:hypothetical protein L798_05165 [Zootermopsis nevadensis]|uniref:Uncharacterized protein n=1 Tax=Zootermopsis nevadensis TaxID=136037 RepID=A0A067QFE0_ZOONE|nr:hypothetical protein L798_05165 [Zootermopsis nevadensis]
MHTDTNLIMQQIVEETKNFRTDLKMKLNEMGTRTEEQEESAVEAVNASLPTSEAYGRYMKEVEDMKADVTKLKEKVKNEEQILKCNLTRLEEDCVDIVVKMPFVEEEGEQLKDSRENVQLMTDHISKVNEEARSFFQEYDANYEDSVQKLKGQLSEHKKQRESKK